MLENTFNDAYGHFAVFAWSDAAFGQVQSTLFDNSFGT